jgi:hypothetical protein
MVEHKVTVTKDNASWMLERLRSEMPTIDRLVRDAICAQIVGHIQKNFLAGQALHRKTGDLAASIHFRSSGAHSTAVGSYGVIYARIHELGGDIYPVKKKSLRFQIGNKWITTRHVRIPARPYLLPGILTYFEYGYAERTGEAILQRELTRIEQG